MAKRRRQGRRPAKKRRSTKPPSPSAPATAPPRLGTWEAPRYSRKTKRITVQGVILPGVQIQLAGSPATIRAAASWGHQHQALGGAVIAGLEQAAAAGPFTRRRQLARIKEAAALTYLDLRYGVPEDLAPLVEWAQAALTRRVGALHGFTRSERRILLVAMLVSSTREWRALKLADPFRSGADAVVESFYKRYIRPALISQRFRFLPRPSEMRRPK